MARTNPGRRAALADAALAVLAADGAHGLTHRAVDRAAGLPSGTAVNYFRSREALWIAAAERAVALHLAAMAHLDRSVDVSTSADPLVDLVAASLEDAVTTSRERYLAITELRLEARRRPVLADALARLTTAAVTFTSDEHRALGLDVPPEALGTLMTLYGGALLALVPGPGPVDSATVRRVARAVVRGALAADA